MTEKIQLREFCEQDRDALENIIRETWQYDELCSADTAAKLARVYLYSCLCNQTFTCTAAADGIPVGIIMGKNIHTHKCPLKLRMKSLLSILSLYLSPEGRKVSKIFGNVSGIDKELYKKSPGNYQGEVSFFVVSSACRGQGLGKKLFHALLAYMKKENIHEIYLYTDTSCNYPFYEHQGMSRRCHQKSSFTINGQNSEMTFFLYDCHC